MKRFYALRNRDAADVYVKALEQAGFKPAPTMQEADFLLYDYERASGGKRVAMAEFLNSKPGFIYPHTPLAYFLWDGIYPSLPVRCNFVHGEGAKQAMKLYGYPYQVEACGFGRCEIREFQPTAGSRLLFVPARTRKDGGYASKEYKTKTVAAFLWILKNKHEFESVTMCHTNTLEDVGIAEYEQQARDAGVVFVHTDPYHDTDPLAAMVERIKQADLAISCETVGCVSVALGKPTVFYNARAAATTLKGTAATFEKYRSIYSFPLTLEEMTVADVLNARIAPSAEVERWKMDTLGGSFDAGKFVRIIQENLQ